MALLVAVVAALAALFGAAIGGFFSYLGTSEQVKSTQLEAQRTVRQTAYSEFYRAVQNVTDISSKMQSEVAMSADNAEVKNLNQHYGTAYSQLDEKMSVVKIVGSRPLAALAEDLKVAIDNYYFDAAHTFTTGRVSGQAPKFLKEQSDAELNFETQAKKDLGITD